MGWERGGSLRESFGNILRRSFGASLRDSFGNCLTGLLGSSIYHIQSVSCIYIPYIELFESTRNLTICVLGAGIRMGLPTVHCPGRADSDAVTVSVLIWMQAVHMASPSAICTYCGVAERSATGFGFVHIYILRRNMITTTEALKLKKQRAQYQSEE